MTCIRIKLLRMSNLRFCVLCKNWHILCGSLLCLITGTSLGVEELVHIYTPSHGHTDRLYFLFFCHSLTARFLFL